MNQANKQEAKVALVTGGARRIGKAIVSYLHKAGYKVVIHCHHSFSEAQALAKELNVLRADSVLVLQRELIRADFQEMIQKIINWAGRLDLIVNNASHFLRDPMSHDERMALFQINTEVPFLLSLAAREELAKHQGSILNITDIHAQKPLQEYSTYCQSKAALEAQTKSLAREFAPEVRVNAIAPGAIAWPEGENSLSKEKKQKIIEKTLLKRHGEPVFIAQAILALAENPFITGQILQVDGGRSLA